MHNRAAIAAIAPRSRSSRRDRGAIANKFLQGYTNKGKGKEKEEEKKRKGMVTLLLFILATLVMVFEQKKTA